MPRLPMRLIDDLGWAGRLKSVAEMPAGFSGARVFRVTLDSGDVFAAKQLPSGVSADRIAEVHSVWQALPGADFTELPTLMSFADGSTCRSIDSRYWEVSSWVPGDPLLADADAGQIERGAALIGRAHAASRRILMREQRSSSIRERYLRLRSIGETSKTVLPTLKTAPEIAAKYSGNDPAFIATYSRAVSLLNGGWPASSERLLRSIERMTEQTLPCIYVFRDVHREHLLFERDRTHVIDFDAMRVDSPMLDLARWIGSFDLADQSPQNSIWQSSLAAYQRETTFINVGTSDQLITLHQATSWASLANWVDWVASGRSFRPGINVICDRIDRIADCVSGMNLSRWP
ncbi:Phosphotransferase enzyme family protein [Rubripirellula obstinata]|uniref:Phosphotransferase enzyme family protein n=1 Tax=Rubripirellula obstinata TaxID=406547 RepID=A0A5B1CDU9_9BACT|nr:phosphotransferase [Rubripirellula obstinata]KAA1257770.1 Phosphotransferase enzyme family protein [Rubripirellula obstinata]